MSTTIYDVLKKEHSEVSEILEKLSKTDESDVAARTKLFGKLQQELEAHAEAEQNVFYPELEGHEETRDIALEGRQEHHVVKTLLSELERGKVDTETWTAKLTVLKENVEHHVEEEEDEMFKKAKKVLDEETAILLAQRFKEAKAQLMAAQ